MRSSIATFAAVSGAILLATQAPAATSFTQAQITSATAGLQDMRELNVFTVGNLNENSHVQGKAFVGGSLNGACGSLSCTTGSQNTTSNAAFGQGNGNIGSAVSTRPTLAVTGNTNVSFDLQNGANGGNGTQGKTVDVGGNLNYTQNVNPDGWTVRVGNNLAPIGNVNSGPSITYGGSYSGNTGNGRVYRDATLAAGGANDLAASLTTQRDTMVTDLTNLSNVLASLSDTGSSSVNGTDRTLTFSSNSLGYNAITLDAASFFNGGTAGSLSISFTGTASSAAPIIINLIGTIGATYTDKINMNFADALAADVIFNFVNIAGVDIQANWTGSILGLGTTVMNSSNITGSVAVNTLNQNAEVHLGTYAGSSAMIPSASAVPEPASWGLMILGFGVIGGALRSHRAKKAHAA